MPELQEILAVLLGAESEAKRVQEEAKQEAESTMSEAQDKFMRQREHRMAAAREQAAGLLNTAALAAKAEAEAVLESAKKERERMVGRFAENAHPVVAAIATETAERARNFFKSLAKEG